MDVSPSSCSGPNFMFNSHAPNDYDFLSFVLVHLRFGFLIQIIKRAFLIWMIPFIPTAVDSVHITKNIQEYMIQKLGIDESIVADMCFVLYKHYGTTLAGLRAIGYNFDYDDFHGFVHGRLPYELLKPDLVLRNLLHGLPIRKVVFTNGDEAHLSRALERLGLVDCFDRIICFETLNPTKGNNASHDSHENASEIFDIMKYCADPDGSGLTLPKTPVVCKPFEDAYEEAFKLAEIDPKRTLFFDDSVRNVVVASSLGLHCVLVGKSERPEGVECALESIHNMKEAIPELREGDEKSESIIHPQEIAIETSVVA
ncbi:hypothetical protein AKJ16_DCAP09748 [Drosera capensis]